MGIPRKVTSKAVMLLLTLIMFSIMMAAPSTTQANAVKIGPPLDKVYIEVRMSQDVGIGDTAAGALDTFLWDASPAVYDRLPEEMKEALKLIPSRTGYRGIVFSPVYSEGFPPGVMNSTLGETHFNPFALTKVRYAMNWLFDREFIIESMFSGGGAPMFSAIQPAQVAAHTKVEHVYTELGLTETGDEAKALAMIEEALNEVIPELQAAGYDLYKETAAESPAGYWWKFKRPDATEEIPDLKFYMRTEDERLYIGRYVADQIEEAGIKIDRKERDRTICSPAIYYTDPLDWDNAAQLYTEGWVSMSEWPYREWGCAQMYAEWYYGYMPGRVGWQWVNETMNELTKQLCYGQVANVSDYWNKMAEVTKGGVQESVRIFLCENWDYFPVNPRVTNMAYGMVSGLWPAWPLRTATTPDNILRAAEYSAEGELFMSAWNPVEGFADVYSELMYRYIHDYGSYPHPMTGEPIPMRATWEVETDYEINETGDITGYLNVPSTALNYSAYDNEWYEIGTGKTAAAKVIFNYKFANWHHYKPMTMTDVLYATGWMYEWATEDYPGDPYYLDVYSARATPTLQTIKGWEIINETALAVYGDYVHPVSGNVTADYYVVWPAHPWEQRAAMDYVIVNGGPVSGEPYSWDGAPGTRFIDMIEPDHITDIREAVAILKNAKFVPPETIVSVTGYNFTPSADDAEERYTADIDWVKEYGHLCISNGPYYLSMWDETAMYAEFTAFRDPTYPFTSDYWQKELFLEKLSIDKIEAPTTVQVGQDISIDVYPTLIREYPEPTTEPATKGYVDVALKNATDVVCGGAASYVEPGLFSFTAPSEVTAELPAGSYTIEATAAIYPGVYPDILTQEIAVLPITYTYTLTLSIVPAYGGNCTPAVGPHEYDEGTTVEVNLTLAEGYEFDYWELDGAEVSDEIAYTLTMNADHTLRAQLKAIAGFPTELIIAIVAIIIAVAAVAGLFLWRRKA
jgi:peptide/nickel transport system substrate-binding protein